MRALFFTLATALSLAGLLCGCGGSATKTGSTGRAPAGRRPVSSAEAPPAVPKPPASVHPGEGLRSLEVDEDDDDTAADLQPNVGTPEGDGDADFDNDHRWLGGFYDGDDAAVLAYGHAPDAVQKRALTALAKRYYAAAAAGNGVGACALLTPVLVSTVTEDYGHGSAGPAYLSAARGCRAVMTLLFKHVAAELADPVEVVAVRVGSGMALVLVGSTTLPARELELQRVGSGWRVASLLGLALP